MKKPSEAELREKISVLRKLLQYLGIKQATMKKNLYAVTLQNLNVDISPRDLAPDVLGCAESVSEMVRKVLPGFPVITGTSTLYATLLKHPKFRRVAGYQPGTIIISPTGMGDGAFPGHTGICLAGEKIASNTSANGKFEQNYTQESWRNRWGAHKFPIYYFDLIN